MLHYSIAKAKENLNSAQPIRTLQLHADNCGGQNKNRFVLWYFLWRATVQLEDEITLFFLIAGHTKNRCDGAFGFVKRELKIRNAICPSDMVDIVRDSPPTNTAILSADMRWVRWKAFLEKFYTVPSSFRITKYHVFKFTNDDPLHANVKRVSSDSEWIRIRLLNSTVTPTQVRAETAEGIGSPDMTASWKPLTEVPSAHEGNRKAYLQKNIIDRYYRNNSSIARKYFENGK